MHGYSVTPPLFLVVNAEVPSTAGEIINEYTLEMLRYRTLTGDIAPHSIIIVSWNNMSKPTEETEVFQATIDERGMLSGRLPGLGQLDLIIQMRLGTTDARKGKG